MNDRVNIMIIATGPVGSGKSRAIETIINSLSRSKIVKVKNKPASMSSFNMEMSTLTVDVLESYKSKG